MCPVIATWSTRLGAAIAGGKRVGGCNQAAEAVAVGGGRGEDLTHGRRGSAGRGVMWSSGKIWCSNRWGTGVGFDEGCEVIMAMGKEDDPSSCTLSGWIKQVQVHTQQVHVGDCQQEGAG